MPRNRGSAVASTPPRVSTAQSTLTVSRRDRRGHANGKPSERKLQLPGWVSLPNSAVASCVSVLVTNPMDRAKTLMQLPGSAKTWGKSMREVVKNMVQKEGALRGPYRGLPVAMARESSKNVFRIGLFAPILMAIHENDDAPAPAWKRFAAGCMSGAVGAVSSNPFDLIKTRMQVPAAMCEYENGFAAFKKICAKEGWKTLYKGVWASVMRDMLGSSVNLTVQSIASEALVRNMILSPGSPVLGAVSGVLSAAASVAVMQPIDTSRAYVYLKPHIHKNVMRAFRYIVIREGPLALYKGSGAHFLRTAPHYAAMFALLELITGSERNMLLKRNKSVLEKVHMFDALSEEKKARLACMVETKHFKAGETIVSAGDNSPGEMYIMTHGSVKVADAKNGNKSDYEGHDVIHRGGYFGETFMVTSGPSQENVTAVNDVSLMAVPREAFESCLAEDDASIALFDDGLTDPAKEIGMAWRRLRYERTLANIPVFKDLGSYERAMVVKQSKRYSYKPGQKVIRRGEQADKFYIVLKGSAVSTKSDSDVDRIAAGSKLSEDRILRHFGPGHYFGELALLTGQPRLATVVADEPLDVLAIDKDVLKSLRSSIPTLEDAIIRNLRRFDHMDSFTTMSIA
ncbi:RmlC-like jelly roll fold [Ostreococcus tauri]|uniref:RmlC-like jelly roll fold n=1 Tax=Ostreococcus tauri TaxID=70448 RepID=A0A090M4S0_OSTTA|nr:RmlC-like jelly roll fold [Ostreococcus tauri]CEF97119.1 RmlC-like jelly roll fold [Ostreococcus tauri]|eukprot:XP_022838497.1 RmlC-like jelly roll fold [Ostreococcus tauri]